MQELKDHFTKLIETPDRLHLWRKKAWDRLEEQTVSLDAPLPPIALCPGGDHVPEENTFVFVDGFFQGAKLPSPIVCMKMDAALLVYGAFLQNRWNRSLAEEKDPFALMNGALQGRGAFLYVPPNARLEAPLRMIHRFTAKTMAFPRLQIFLGKGSSLKIIEKTEGDIFSLLCNTHIDVSLDSGSSLTFLNESRASPQARYFSSLRASLKRDSCLQSLVLSDGALFSRHSVRVQLLEENSEALLRGLWRLSGERQSHTNVLVEHIAPHCRSRQHFKGVLGDRSR